MVKVPEVAIEPDTIDAFSEDDPWMLTLPGVCNTTLMFESTMAACKVTSVFTEPEGPSTRTVTMCGRPSADTMRRPLVGGVAVLREEAICG